MAVSDTASHKVSSWNRQTYQRLKLSLSLGLRRQLFVAVCDDLSLRNRLASKLQTDLALSAAKESTGEQNCSKLVSLELNLSNPNPLAHVAQWLLQHQPSRVRQQIPGFQILGVEGLTRQPPELQRLFLRRLQATERNLAHLESTLLLWLPRPWFHTIQQSVPEFWQWHTGIFEFEGEPTPLPPVGAARPEASPTAKTKTSHKAAASFKEDLRKLLADDSTQMPKLTPVSQASLENQHPSDLAQSLIKGKFAANNEVHELAQPISDAPQPAYPGYQAPPPTNYPNSSGSVTPTPSADHLPSAQEPVETPNHLQPVNLPQGNQDKSAAEAYLELGNYYRQVIEQGDNSEENLAIAIQAYEQALQCLPEESLQTSDILNDIGNLYWMLSRCPTSAEHTLSYLEQGIQAYQLALTKLSAQEAPQTYSMIQNNLGAAYGDLARYQDQVENLENSVRAYEQALHYRLPESEPRKYASTQNNLGTAYWNLAQHQSPVANLKAAITAYKEALSHYNPETEPLNWAMIQNNLGTGYWNLAQYERPETWLKLAIFAYQDALNYRTPEVAPAACAATQNNLGTAYWHLADRFQAEDDAKAEYLEKCVTAYEKALAAAGCHPFAGSEQPEHKSTPIPVNFDVFATHNNLGLAHYQLATEPQLASSQNKSSKSTHLEAALHQHLQACTNSSVESETYQTAVTYAARIIRTFYDGSGITGQNRALSKVPGQLLPDILPRL
ncbi:tetratricopeptide repeat protein [Lyngbya aestuarii]|uniref:tetratricopeptide repeat protein n=1 Tax=Lyngbya aestuarii TaxID=118322 RepID=UPI00403DD465